MRHYGLLASVLFTMAGALDLEFDKITCDDTLPFYAVEDGISVQCNGDSRCTFGDSMIISGNVFYDNLMYSGMGNNTGYASANLQLLTLEYDLFEFLPFRFCGDWLDQSATNTAYCPADGRYPFQISYALPETKNPTTWFATGWEGVTYLKIYQSQTAQSPLLGHCKIHFKTYVTDPENSDWYTLPSAAKTTAVLFGILALLFAICMCLACQPTRRHPTDEDYIADFKMEDGKPAKKVDPEQPEKAMNMALKMGYKA